MKLFAQHGASQGDRTMVGIEHGYVDGVIYSPRDIRVHALREHVAKVATVNDRAEQYLDPQYYAAYNVSHRDARLGQLGNSDEYGSYFRECTRRQLEDNLKRVRDDIRDCLKFQCNLDMTGIISPNILISRSFDSIEAVISKRFIREAGRVYSELDCGKPLYITLAVSRDALTDWRELFAFLEDATVLGVPPDGFYVLIASANEDARAEIYNADVIAGWLLINHVLSLNGYAVLNGYSDLLTPFLSVGGATAGATGWWSNLRSFSLSRFLPAGQGRLPIQRYLSKRLLNRITYYELEQLREICPKVLNGLETDAFYPSGDGAVYPSGEPGHGSEPKRADEVLQSWQTIKTLCDDLCEPDIAETLRLCRLAIEDARNTYAAVESYVRLDPKSNGDHLVAIEEGLRQFGRLAEIEDTTLDLR
ncbi:MAG: hypothetical protein NTW96_09035 [Planctomycetia bacterium]|nr:hypothetical protein [Planctomycetia bacterium]